MSILLRLTRYLRPEAARLTLAYICMLGLAVATSFYAFLAGPALNFVFTGDVGQVLRSKDGDLRYIWSVVPQSWITQFETLDKNWALWIVPILIVVTALLKGIAQVGQFYLTAKISQRILQALRGDTFAALLRQSPAFFTKRSHGDLVSRLTQDTLLIEQAVFYGCAPILRDTLSLVALLVFCFSTDAQLATVTFITVPLAIIPLNRFTKWLKRVSKRGQAAQGEISAVAYEALAGVRVVQAFTNEAHEQQRLSNAGERYLKQTLTSYFIRAIRTPTMETLGAIALAALLGFLGFHVQRHGADPSRYISFFAAIVMMYDPLKKLGRVSDYLAAGAASAERVFELIDHVPDVADAPEAQALVGFTQAVTFRDVHFSYNSQPVLQGINLDLPRGSVVALVGVSGSGKSTLAHLLPRFYDVTQGQLLIDGQDIRKVTLESLRAQISVVSQDTFLFNVSIAENIAYGSADATPEAIKSAARAAYADEFIERLPQGYDTIIGERGITLSGGQRQRLAIARALLRNAPLLILDEATSSLDIESERYVQEALDRLMQGRTCLVIAHRLSTIRNASMIAVLKDGVIVERGQHHELLAIGREYARLHQLQFFDQPMVALS